MGQVRNARRAQSKAANLPRHDAKPKPKTHHEHKGGKAHSHRHAGAHEHETPAERFARRYPNGSPFGAKGQPEGEDVDSGPNVHGHGSEVHSHAGGSEDHRHVKAEPLIGSWWDRHTWAAVLIALIVSLALIAVFTPTGESTGTVQPTGTATLQPTARSVVYPPVASTATARPPRPTATPIATPCPAPTLPYCEQPPAEQAPASGTVDANDTPQPTAQQGASIGGTGVSERLHCQEDEVIGYLANDTLGCVHVEGSTLEGGTY